MPYNKTMSTIRHFSGSRERGKKSIAREILQLEAQKKGKLPTEMRYKLIFKRKQEEAREKAMEAMAAKESSSSSSGKMVTGRKMSERAEQALKEIAMKKAAKEQKKLRRMVIVEPMNFSNGSINKKGQIFDIAGNIVGQVNLKNGNMSASNGWSIGKYKPKSYLTKLLIEQAINKYSPYFVQQRKLQAQAASMSSVHGGFSDPNVMNVHGVSAQMAMLGGGVHGGLGGGDYGVFGREENQTGWGAAGTVGGTTSWGGMANNPWGNFSGNVHGNVADNVHGTMNADVWGGVGAQSMWGVKGVRLYGTGSGVNRLSGITKYILGLFGYRSRAARAAMREIRSSRLAQGGSGNGPRAPAPRAGRR